MKKVAIIGTGTMGRAIQERLTGDYDVIGLGRSDNLSAARPAGAVVLAVKPQSFAELAAELRPNIRGQLVLSIMAGVCIHSLSEQLGTEQVVRTMPNLALRAGKSLTAWYAHDGVEAGDIVEPLLATWGTSIRLQSERQFDAFTALAGSGPAYFYRLAGLLAENALQRGFTPEQARLIGSQTLTGAASVVQPGAAPEDLARAVASKGGTTEAAFGVFDEMRLPDVVARAIDAAAARSRELGDLL